MIILNLITLHLNFILLFLILFHYIKDYLIICLNLIWLTEFKSILTWNWSVDWNRFWLENVNDQHAISGEPTRVRLPRMTWLLRPYAYVQYVHLGLAETSSMNLIEMQFNIRRLTHLHMICVSWETDRKHLVPETMSFSWTTVCKWGFRYDHRYGADYKSRYNRNKSE